MEFRRRIILVLALCLAVALPAIAGPGDGAMSAEERAQYEKRYKEGLALLAAARFDEARSLYRELWVKRRSFDVASQLAQAEMGLAQYRDAAEHFAYAIAFFAPSVRSEPRSVVEKRLQAAKKSVLTVKLDLDPKDASLTVGGAPVELIDGYVYVEVGEREIRAQKSGFSSAGVSVNGGAGTETTASLRLKELPESGLAASDAGTEASSDAAAPDASANDADAGVGTNHRRNIVPGLIAGGALATVGLAIGLGFTFAANSTRNDADDLDSQLGNDSSCSGGNDSRCQELSDKLHTLDRQRNISYIGFGVAGAAAIGTLVYVLWPSPAQSASAPRGTRFRPSVGIAPRGGFIGIGNEF